MYKKHIFGKSKFIKFKGADILINKNYFSNITSKNILNNPKEKSLSDTFSNSYTTTIIENMVLNSNLDNETIIK